MIIVRIEKGCVGCRIYDTNGHTVIYKPWNCGKRWNLPWHELRFSDGTIVKIVLLESKLNRCKIGIDAPKHVKIDRLKE